MSAGDNLNGAALTPEQRASIQQMTQDMQGRAAVGMNDPQMQNLVSKMSRRADDIADKDVTGERRKILKFIGLNPDSQYALYTFVSWSMPLEMLRSYALEAMWTGGSLVFRGLPPGRTLGQFYTKDLRQIVYDKGASAIINLDPRLYDTYKITAVPTIVLTSDRSNLKCLGAGTQQVATKGVQAHYNVCPPMDPKSYWKISGAVTTDYALEQFKAVGSPGADAFLKALAKAYQDGHPASKEQLPFSGDWKSIKTPAAQLNGTQGTAPAPASAPAPFFHQP